MRSQLAPADEPTVKLSHPPKGSQATPAAHHTAPSMAGKRLSLEVTDAGLDSDQGSIEQPSPKKLRGDIQLFSMSPAAAPAAPTPAAAAAKPPALPAQSVHAQLLSFLQGRSQVLDVEAQAHLHHIAQMMLGASGTAQQGLAAAAPQGQLMGTLHHMNSLDSATTRQLPQL